MNNLILRTDASTEIGIGHVMRCLALAQAWQDAGGKVTFVMAMESPAIEARLRSEGIGVVYLDEIPGSMGDAIQTLAVAERHNAQWIVLDGYNFDGAYQKEIKRSTKKLLIIDDYGHADRYYADIVLNQNLHAHDHLYCKREPYTKLLLGTRFVLLRREFSKWRGWKRECPTMVRRILVTFGGSDEQNASCKVVRALKQADLNGAEVSIIVGLTNLHLEVIRKELMTSRFKFQLLNSVNDMATLMARADVAISASGSTCWELAFMGLPSLLLPLADNQVAIADELDKRGAAFRLDGHEADSGSEMASRITHLMRSHDTRSMMTEKGQKLVDGEGTERVLMHMRGETLRLRKVREGDCKLLWEWANEPETREMSFSKDPIPWEDHMAWFRNKVMDANSSIFIALDEFDTPIGQIRFNLVNHEEAEIDVSVKPTRRGQGNGALIVGLGAKTLLQEKSLRGFHAFVRPENVRSSKAFEKAGFVKIGKENVKGCEAIHYISRSSRG